MAKGNFWLGTLVGAAAGAATALLLAPKRGSELRQDIAEKSRDVGRKAGEAWGDVKGRVSHAAAGAKDKVQMAAGKSQEMMAKGRERARDAVAAGRQAATEKRKELETHIQEQEHKAA